MTKHKATIRTNYTMKRKATKLLQSYWQRILHKKKQQQKLSKVTLTVQAA
jgi:hypothetical protein